MVAVGEEDAGQVCMPSDDKVLLVPVVGTWVCLHEIWWISLLLKRGWSCLGGGSSTSQAVVDYSR